MYDEPFNDGVSLSPDEYGPLHIGCTNRDDYKDPVDYFSFPVSPSSSSEDDDDDEYEDYEDEEEDEENDGKENDDKKNDDKGKYLQVPKFF